MKLTLALLLFSFNALAYEVDNFSERYIPLKDSRDVMNAEVNSRLTEALETLDGYNLTHAKEKLKGLFTADTSQCNPENLEKALEGTLRGNRFIGSLESYARNSPNLEKTKLATDIYENKEWKDSSKGIMLALFGIFPSFNLNGQFIGSDKFGHFFDEGHNDFERFQERSTQGADYKESVKAALDLGLEQEKGENGLKTTHILSHADLAAEFSGFQFWNQISSGKNPYFRCQDGKWKQVRQFDWADYVGPAWDEGLNCSEYTGGLDKVVSKNLKDMEKSGGGKNKYVCPISVSECKKIYAQYHDSAPSLVSPSCTKVIYKDDAPEKASSAQIPYSKFSSGSSGTSGKTKAKDGGSR